MNSLAPERPAWRGAPIVLLTIGLAWLLAIGAEVTGRMQWVHQHQLDVDGIGLAASLALFLVAWQVHIAAMMLPSALPMIALFNRTSAGQPNATAARAGFLGGYLAVWTAFGLTALAGHATLAPALRHAQLDPAMLAGIVIILAGVFQFSTLKDRCLDKCRQPRSFLLNHYRRGTPAAIALGTRHGLFCLGCCWALMVVMFIVGIANLAWMAPLTLLMLYEKIGRHGDRIARPAGAALILLGVFVSADPTGIPPLMAAH